MKKRPKIDFTKIGLLPKLQVIEWLLDPINYRATGRSHVMLLAYVNLAFRYPHTWINVRDHFPSNLADEFLMSNIQSFVKKEFPKLNWYFQHNSFKLGDIPSKG